MMKANTATTINIRDQQTPYLEEFDEEESENETHKDLFENDDQR